MTSTPATDAYDSLPDAVTEIFGEDATAEHAYDLLTVDVPATAWIAALETARDRLGCTYFDWLSAVDEPGTGFRVCAHVAAPAHGKVRRLLIRTTVPHDAAALPTAVGVYSGAAWHERETHEMFGIGFEGHPHLVPLLLPDGFEGHPLRKDFVLAARVAKAWPGAKEPGESEHGGPKRRTMLPPGVPDPNEWGPLKGQLPPAPTRPARTARAAGDRPVRRARSVSEGSASQQPEAAAPAASTETAPPTPTPTPRRTRSASQGSASQQGRRRRPSRQRQNRQRRNRHRHRRNRHRRNRHRRPAARTRPGTTPARPSTRPRKRAPPKLWARPRSRVPLSPSGNRGAGAQGRSPRSGKVRAGERPRAVAPPPTPRTPRTSPRHRRSPAPRISRTPLTSPTPRISRTPRTRTPHPSRPPTPRRRRYRVNDVLDVALRLVIVFGVFMVVPLVVGQTEHKVMAHMQGRLGPMYAGGFHGWAQLVADGVKFAQKEDIVPADADRRIFQLAPAVALLPYLLVLVAIPIGPSEGAVGQVVDAGIFFVLAVMGVGVLGSLMAGWASANKFSLLGGLRTAAQLLAYELPMLLAAASVAMAAGTVSLPGIVNAFEWWWLPWQIVGALVFFVAGLAELQRPPFDMPVADSEIIFGAYTEYTGLRFALFLLAEYAGIVVLCGLTTVLFLGGWHGPLGADGLGWVWTLVKTAALAFVVIWLRVSYPRLREDQLQKLAWTTLIPLSLAQIALTGIVKVAIS